MPKTRDRDERMIGIQQSKIQKGLNLHRRGGQREPEEAKMRERPNSRSEAEEAMRVID